MCVIAGGSADSCSVAKCCSPLNCAGAVTLGVISSTSCSGTQVISPNVTCGAPGPACSLSQCCSDTCATAGVRCTSAQEALQNSQTCVKIPAAPTVPASSLCNSANCCRSLCEPGASTQRPYTCIRSGNVYFAFRMVNNAVQCASNNNRDCRVFASLAACRVCCGWSVCLAALLSFAFVLRFAKCRPLCMSESIVFCSHDPRRMQGM